MLSLAAAAGGQEPAEPTAAAPQSAKIHLISVNPAEVPAPLPLDPDSVAPAVKPAPSVNVFLSPGERRVLAVLFAGVGEVAPALSDFDSENLLPSGGCGIRFLLAKENRINFRIDYTWGKSGSKGVYVGVGEAF